MPSQKVDEDYQLGAVENLLMEEDVVGLEDRGDHVQIDTEEDSYLVQTEGGAVTGIYAVDGTLEGDEMSDMYEEVFFSAESGLGETKELLDEEGTRVYGE